MYEEISPKYIMLLIDKINYTLYDMYTYPKYEKVEWYMQKRKQMWYNFWILKDKEEHIKLIETLTNISDNELIIKIAMDLWIETPWFIPAVSKIKNELKEENENIHDTFMKAFKEVEENPSLAIWMANSTLESIIKTILQDDRIVVDKKDGDTLYKLSIKIIKVIWLEPKDLPEEIKQIWSWLLSSCQWIENLRSTKTDFHWKTKNDIVIKNSTYAYFVVNAVSTIGLFLLEIYKENYPEQKTFNPEDLPF